MSEVSGIMDPVPAAPRSSTLVGRDAELEQLCSWLGIGASGAAAGPDHVAPPAVLLAGDAGVGKTRLLTELRDRAFAAGWNVGAGHCLDFADSALPYLPFSEILGRLDRELPDVVAAVVEAHPTLARLQPGRRLRTGEGDDAASLARGDLFPAIHALLEAVAEHAPFLVVIEDAHWADQSTRDMLSFLFTRPFSGPVAVVASYRSDDLHRRHPLRRQVAEWSRLRDVQRLQLDPLRAPDVRRLVRGLVRGLHADGLTAAEVAQIVARAEGNAFFVEELVVAARGSDGGLPDDLADVLLVRLDRLDDDATRIVRVASASGRRVSHAMLAQASGLVDDELEQGIRRAVEMNVLEPRGDDSYVFRHALLGEAVYDDLLPGERVRLHATYAAAIVDGRAPGSAAELARHARLGQDPATALRASIEAGGDAMRVGAPEEAAQHFQHALALRTAPGVGELDDSTLARLVTRTADALIAAGHFDRAAAVVREQLDRLDTDAPPALRGELLTALATAVGMTDTSEDLVAWTREAVDLTADAPAVVRVRALSFHARALSADDQHEPARQVALEALGEAEKHDLPRLATDALTTLVGLDRDGPVEEVRRSMEDVIRRARAARAVNAELRALYFLGRLHQDRAEHDLAADAFARGVRRGAAAGTPWAPYAFDCRFMQASVALERGAWSDVLELTDMGGQAPPPLNEAMLTSLRVRVGAARGEADALARAKALRRTWRQEGLVAIGGATAELTVHEHRRDPQAAVEVYDAVVRSVTVTWREFFQARLRLAATTLGVLASAAAGRGGDGLVEEQRLAWAPTADRLAEDGRRVLADVRESGLTMGPEGQAWAARLEAEVLRWRWAADLEPPDEETLVAAWRRAEEAASAYGNPSALAQVRTHFAIVLRAVGETARAREVADLARDTARHLGLSPLIDDLTAAGGAGRGSRTGRARRPAPASDALTPREEEILALVAQGRTNGEIARQLYISVKTVSVHVSNILGKLGAASRTEAAALARRKGLLP
ncbi:helix-turn-helix transcriptional regulator [Nocardioides alkalitolerans]|uniref:helix-turn-helix transcriptional regulator n=1 Tax=Nocardioides alkalitolerans TaxID=281714 RepID=UPI0004286A32|nr:helix-turn-helix transcriptional regulator [Nocardioides alkalitolerans]